MDHPNPSAVTEMLAAVSRGDQLAAERLLPVIYHELRRLARARMANLRPGQTLQPTALVHEAYVRLVGDGHQGWDNRGHFFAAAAGAMRDILVEQARRRASQKRGGDRQRVDIDAVDPPIAEPSEELLAIHEALQHLEAEDSRKRQLVNLRYFAGMSNEETAVALGVSVGTVERDWRFVRAWLKRVLNPDGPGNSAAVHP